MRLETKAIHAGTKSDPGHGSVVTPIHQTAGYEFPSAESAAKRFLLEEFGQIYSRMGNPTVDQFEARMTALHDGVASLATASGMTAASYAIMNICRAGDNFVTSRHLYGGVSNLFANILYDFGIEARFVDDHTNPDEFKRLADEKTRLFWGETLPNPSLETFPIADIAKAADEIGVPLVVDNTCAPPPVCNPFDHGAHLAIYSATKYIGGHGNAIGGVVIDSGKFDWSKDKERFHMLNKPDASLHGLVWTEKFGEMAYMLKLRATMMRDFGGCLAPMNAFPGGRAHVLRRAGEAMVAHRPMTLIEEMAEFVGDREAPPPRMISGPDDDLPLALQRVGLQAALDPLQRRLDDLHDVERQGDLVVARRAGHGHQAAHGERQGIVDHQPLRHITDAQPWGPLDPALIRLN